MSSLPRTELKPTPYWWDEAPPVDAAMAALPPACDVAVIGSGFAGLSAALELARSGANVVVLDSDALGAGASTRNSGSVSVRFDLQKVMQHLRARGPEAREELARLAQAATESIDFVETLMQRERIACEYAVRGSFLAACVPRHYEGLARRAEAMKRYFGVEAYVVGRSEQRNEIASDYYHGGMVTERTGQLNPALYHRGLLDACLRCGVAFSSHTRVNRIARNGSTFELDTVRGRLGARDVVVATNGYTGASTPNLRRRVISVSSHIISTEPLSEALAKELLPRRRVVSDTKRLLCYYRMIADGRRLLFGGRASLSDAGPEVAAPRLERQMLERFPQLRGVRITHAWSGQVAFTFDALPHMGRDDGQYYCMGCNANGVAIMTYLGYQTARKVIGGNGPVCAFDGRAFPARPYYSGRPWFLPVVTGWYRLCDSIDRSLG